MNEFVQLSLFTYDMLKETIKDLSKEKSDLNDELFINRSKLQEAKTLVIKIGVALVNEKYDWIINDYKRKMFGVELSHEFINKNVLELKKRLCDHGFAEFINDSGAFDEIVAVIMQNVLKHCQEEKE